MTTVSFPGLGIGEFSLNKIALAFNLFGLEVEIRWYGLLITIGIILALLYAAWRSRQEGISLDDMLDISMFAIILGVIGARIYYVLTYGVSTFFVYEGTKFKFWATMLNMIAVWNGGIAIYGAIIAGALTVYFICRRKKISYFKVFDAVAPAVMIGQILGRWGNFVNGEAYGYEVVEGDFLYAFRMGLLPNIDSSTKMHFYHPTFLYESLWNLAGFLLINQLYKKKKFDGQVFLMYVTWYGFGRMLIEGLRTDSLYIGVFRVSQVVGFCSFIAGAVLIYLGLKKAKKTALQGAGYEPVYPKFVKKISEAEKVTPVSADVIDEKTAETTVGSDEVIKDESDLEVTPELADGESEAGIKTELSEDDSAKGEDESNISEDEKGGDDN